VRKFTVSGHPIIETDHPAETGHVGGNDGGDRDGAARIGSRAVADPVLE
jgi:hypothetical protein